MWTVTPLFAEWIASPNFLFHAGYLTSASVALELGAGVSGIVALALGPRIAGYFATDQDYSMKLLNQNISENLQSTSLATGKTSKHKPKHGPYAGKQPSPNIQTLVLDWELDSVSSLPSLLGHDKVDLVVACDCIYNDALIEPLNNTCAQICRLNLGGNQQKPTLCIIAQQLRSPDVFESWLKSFHQLFHVWKIPDELLIPPLRENSGFIVHLGYLR